MLSSPRLVESPFQSSPCMVLWLLPVLISTVLIFNMLSTSLPFPCDVKGSEFVSTCVIAKQAPTKGFITLHLLPALTPGMGLHVTCQDFLPVQ